MIKAAIVCEDPKLFDYVFAAGRRERLASVVSLHPVIINRRNLEQEAPKLKGAEVLFSTWGMPSLTPEQIALLPELKAVFYAAGSVKSFAGPFLDRGVTVVSAWRANAIPVAEFACAQILLACKGYFRNSRESRDPALRGAGKCFSGRGVFGERVGLVGCGMIARHLISLLKPYSLQILVYDPYLGDEEAAKLGVSKTSLAKLFSDCYVISNHLPNLPDLKGVLNAKLFKSMREGATFVNTGRGAQVDEAALIETLKARPDLTALLDVTDPEPPVADSPFYTLPNVQLSSHIAGSLNDEVQRMADYVIEDFLNWEAGRPVVNAVSRRMLETMA